MVAPLIGSLLGLATNASALGLDRAFAGERQERLRRQPLQSKLAQKQNARELNAAAAANAGPNAGLSQRNAQEAQTEGALRFSNQAAAESGARQRQIDQIGAESDKRLVSGLMGLGSGIAGGAQMLGGTDKPSPASQVQGPGGALERLSAGRPEITPQLGGVTPQAPRTTAQNPLGMSMPGTLGAPQPQAPTQPAPYGMLGSVLGQQPAPAPQQALPPPPGLTDTPSNQLFPGNFQDVPAQAPQVAPSTPQAPQMRGATSGQPTAQMAPQAVQQAPVATAPVQPQAPGTGTPSPVPGAQPTFEEMLLDQNFMASLLQNYLAGGQ